MMPLCRFVLIAMLALNLQVHAQKETCPDTHPWTGQIINHSFDFAFDVPKPLKAYWNSARCVPDEKYGCVCLGDHGRIIPLGTSQDKTDHQIEVYADFFDPEDFTINGDKPDNPANFAGDAKPGTLRIRLKQRFQLAGLAATHYVIEYVDELSEKETIQDTWVAVRDDRIRYEVYLRAPVANYEQDRQWLLQIVSSFSLRRSGSAG